MCHQEGIPKSITYFPQNTVNNIFSVYMNNNGKLNIHKKITDTSVFYPTNILKRHYLKRKLEEISDDLKRSDDF